METSRDFERQIVARYNLTSDYQLSKLLGVKPSTISAHRTGDAKTWGEEIGYRIAGLLDLPAEYVLSCLAAERAKDNKVKKVWERVAELTRVAVWLPAVLAVTFAGSAFVTSTPARAGVTDCVYYVKSFALWILRTLARAATLLGMRWTALLLIPLLAACGSESGQDNHGYGYQYDEIGTTGLRVRFDSHPTLSIEEIEALYTEAEACTGIEATGPLVIFQHTTFTTTGGEPVYGQIFLDTGTALISSLIDHDPKLGYYFYKHEFIHYLLHQSGFPLDLNTSHQSPLFNLCTTPPA